MEEKIIENNQIYLIRHAESELNIIRDKIKRDGVDYKITDEVRDSNISIKGNSQAEEARIKMENKNVKVVFTSPMLRTLKTTQIIFGKHKNSPKVIVLPMLRESFFGTHDIPRKVEENLNDFPNFDFSEILNTDNNEISHDFWIFKDLANFDHIINNKKWKSVLDHVDGQSYHLVREKIISNLEQEKEKFTESRIELFNRANRLRNYLKNKIAEIKNEHPDGEIAIVSHAYFLSTFIAEDVDDQGVVKNRRRIENCEIIEYLPKF